VKTAESRSGERGWRACLTEDEVAMYWPDCAEREFGELISESS
jgi:hypothetical protein